MTSSRLEITDFDILNALGSGSYSTVFRARNKRSHDYVAIKTVTKSGLSATSTDNLLREIRLLKTLKHKYIVEMLDFMWDDKNIYIVMELCAGGDLSAYIRHHRRLPESTCKFFLRQLAIALRYMRAHNISHFDLKPSNLLLTQTPALTLKVGDFGFAQHIAATDVGTALKGSPLYMAPEILLHRRYTASADLWSIGCILYECVYGRAPYRSATLDELVHKIGSRVAITHPALRPPLSPACDDLLRRLLQHDPHERIAFEAFFEHVFIDAEHEPNDANHERAVELITHAVRMDTAGDAEAAYAAYCEGLQFLVPLIAAEADAGKRQAMRDNADRYLRRAEEIRCGGCCRDKNAAASTSANKVRRALQPSAAFAALFEASASSPALRDGLEIGRQAELYVCERNYAAAMDAFQRALGLLVPLLGAEPRGTRRDRLHRQVAGWMHEAEQVKVLLAARASDGGGVVGEGVNVELAVAVDGDVDANSATGSDEKGNSIAAYASSCRIQ